MPPATTEAYEEGRLLAAVRAQEARLAALEEASSPEANRCRAEARAVRAQLEALYRRWPGRRGLFVAAT